ncbi:MAG: phosphoglucosamine mutase [Myxococcota bacterium]|nr:phosphoglucosamine mutase [Myxococcota bacterium]
MKLKKRERILFGTDGVRGLANRHPMTGEMAMNLGRALGIRLARGLERRPRVLVGKDTRLSGYLFETAVASGLVSVGADVHLVGPLPTPGIAFLTTGMRCDAGVVISASHNPYQDNGIKLFARDGYKLPDDEELALESLILGEHDEARWATGRDLGRAYRIHDAAGRYSVYAKSAFPRGLSLDGLKIVVDCANGAGYKVAPEVFHGLGADVVAVGVSPDGLNINENCGALNPQRLGELVRGHDAQLGVALDGDADRCILCDERGETIDGDHVLAILARDFMGRGQLHENTVVATIMSNIGLERAMAGIGGQVVRVGVGDRYVVERMRRDAFSLGGEQSGHIIVHSHSTTGDGLVTALSVLAVMRKEEASLSDLAGFMKRFPQAIENVAVSSKPRLDEIDDVRHVIEAVEAELGDEGRVLVRYSGTQMLARVMVEGPSDEIVTESARRIARVIDNHLGEQNGPQTFGRG